MPADHAAPSRSRLRGRFDIALVCGLVALGAGVFAGFAWTRPARVATVVHYRQSGYLAYGGTPRTGSVYGAGGLQTGQPIYLTDVRSVHLRYAYSFGASRPTAVAGTEQLRVSMSNGQGISRTWALQPVTAFSGGHFVATAVLDTATIQHMADLFATVPGGGAGADLPVTVTPVVHVHGAIGPVAVRTAFDPQVDFAFSSGTLTPIVPSSNAPGVPTPPASGLSATTHGSVTLPGLRPVVMIFGQTVAAVRYATLGLLALALLVALIVTRPIRWAASSDEHAGISLRHGGMMVEVAQRPRARSGSVVVELASFPDLAKVARRLECPVLHCGNDGHLYTAVDNGTLYEYRPASAATAKHLAQTIVLEAAAGADASGAATNGAAVTLR